MELRVHSRHTSVGAAFAALLLFSLSGCKANDASPEVVVSVQVAHPTQGAISEEIAADAILAPLSQAALSPRISAAIRAEYVQRGSRVHQGQLLISLESKDLQGAALDTRGALSTALANYTAATSATIPEGLKKAELDAQQLKVASEVAARTADERNKLFQQGALSGRDADVAYAAAIQAKAAYDAARQHAEAVKRTTRITDQEIAKAQLVSAQGRLQSAEAQSSYANLRSPIDGVVTDRPLFPGETASAGSPIITIMDTSSLLAKLHLAQATTQRLMLGHGAKVFVPGMSEPVEATVTFISPALDPGSTTAEVWLKLPNADARFKVGTPVHVVITGNTVQNALRVPPSALLPAADGGTSVMVMGQDGLAHKRTVTIGIRTSAEVEITSGLKATDNVIIDGSYGLDDGTKVIVGQSATSQSEGKN